jgi:hypothetical protein
VVCRHSRLTHVVVRGSHDAPNAIAACLPIIAIVMVIRGRGPLRMLLAPPLVALNTLLGVVDGDVRRCLLVAAWGCLPASLGRTKFDRLVAGGDTTQLLGGVPKNIAVFALAWVPPMAFGSRAH